MFIVMFCYYQNKIANTFKPLSSLRRLVLGSLDLSLESGLVIG